MRVPCLEPVLLCQNKLRFEELCPWLQFRGHSEAAAHPPGPAPHAGWWREQPWGTEGCSSPHGTPRWALGPPSPKGAGAGGFREGDTGQRPLPVTGWPRPQPVAKEQIFSSLVQCPADFWACRLPLVRWTASPIGKSMAVGPGNTAGRGGGGAAGVGGRGRAFPGPPGRPGSPEAPRAAQAAPPPLPFIQTEPEAALPLPQVTRTYQTLPRVRL